MQVESPLTPIYKFSLHTFLKVATKAPQQFRTKMAAKIVKSFRRSLSFPNHHSHSSSKPRETLHIRSTSLPCRSNPLISHLRDEIAELHSWIEYHTSSWLCDGLKRLKAVHETLDDLLHLPQTRDLLRVGEYSDFFEKLLENFLRFVDVYGKFRTLALRLKDECSAAEIAFRRKDESKMALHLKNLNRVGREIGRLVSNVRLINTAKFSFPARQIQSYENDRELIEIINDVLKVTISVSISLFSELSASFWFRKISCKELIFGNRTKNHKIEEDIREIRIGLRKKGDELRNSSKKLQGLGDFIAEIEGCGEKAFRSLINSRVSLLNLLSC